MLFESQKLCISESQCNGGKLLFAEPGYLNSNDGKKECVSAEDCRESGKCAYRNSGECSELEPDLSRDTFQTTGSGDYECASGTVMFVLDKVQCLSYKDCAYGAARGLRRGNMCFSR